MIIVRLKGGLGNQMFQYALGRVLAIKNNTELFIDKSYLESNLFGVIKRDFDLDIFEINFNFVAKGDIPFIHRIYKCKFLNKISLFLLNFLNTKGQEKSFNFDESFLFLKDGIYLEGYFQSPKYFNEYQDVIRKDFTFKDNFSEKINTLMIEIKDHNSLCIHVRRGDFVGNKFHDVVSVDYYHQALALISKKTKIEKIYVFSDDISWCENNLKFDMPTLYVGDDLRGDKASGHLSLMSACHHFIIPNSTFSWWAAFLADNPDKIVIAPKQWFGDTSIDTSDLTPKDWIRI